MKNKALTYLLVGILSLSLIGCGKKEETESVANAPKEVIQEEVNEIEVRVEEEQKESTEEEKSKEVSEVEETASEAVIEAVVEEVTSCSFCNDDTISAPE